MGEKTFYQGAHPYLNKQVEIITTQGTFSGKLLSISQDVVILQSMMRMRPRDIVIRVEQIVALYREEQMPRGPFDFMPQEPEIEESEESQER
ncbi:MAG: hypothetical protein Q8934_05715 [Bacillota bacterium]|nr:hypothetical protein [Bacillota bacterium]